MDHRSTQTTFPEGNSSKFRPKSALVTLALILALTSGGLATAQTRVVIALSSGASAVEKVAADELAANLHSLYPSTKFEIGAPVATVPAVYLGTAQDLPENYGVQVRSKLDLPESFIVETIGSGADSVAVIAGASPRATLFAVDSLLEKLGFGFYLSYSTTPPPSHAPY